MTALLILVLGLTARGLESVGPVRFFEPAPYSDSGIVRFANGTVLDTRVVPGAAGELRVGSYYVVRLAGTVRQEWLVALRGLCLQPVSYIAYQNLVVRVSRTTKVADVRSLGFVDWLGPHPTQAKLGPELLDASGSRELVLALWPGESSAPVLDRIAELAGTVQGVSDRTIRFSLDASACSGLASLDQVAWIQQQDPPGPSNSECQWVVQTGWKPEIPPHEIGRRLWAHGIRGQGMTVGLFDSGIETEHDQFCDPGLPLSGPGVFPEHRKIAAYKLYPEAAFGDAGAVGYHGSGVAGTLAGDDSVCGNLSKADGMAPDARIYFVDVASASGRYVYENDLTGLLDSVRLSRGMREPIPQVSGSFGSSALLGYYRLQEASTDAVLWNDKAFLAVWAAGNDGGGRYKIGHPGGAKNVLTVGACGNGTGSNTMTSFSSRGPTRDGRIKPNLAAPGDALTTVSGPGSCAYDSRNGTSFSTPAVSGALTLLRQYFAEGWYPTGQPDSARALTGLSSCLVRALALSATDPDIIGESLPSYACGWGRLDLDRILHFPGDSTALIFVDETGGIATGEFHEYRIETDRRNPLRIVLAWTDTAAAPEAAVALVNDLDLKVVSPDLNVYHGNQFVNSQSQSNPVVLDSRNTEEAFLLDLPITGDWSIQVLGRSVFSERQPYAVVVHGALAGMPGITSTSGTESGPVRRTRFVTAGRPLQLELPTAALARITGLDGREVYRSVTDRSSTLHWDGGGCAAGIYFLRVDRADAVPLLEKLVLRY